jgi:hypothetical protein
MTKGTCVKLGSALLGTASILAALIFQAPRAFSAENLTINPKLDYKSDSNDGPLIYGKNLDDGSLHPGKPAHVLFTGRA